MSQPLATLCGLLLALVLAARTQAQSPADYAPIRMTADGQRAIVVNTLIVDAVALAVRAGPDSSWSDYRPILIPAKSQITVDSHGDRWGLAQFDLVGNDIPRVNLPRCGASVQTETGEQFLADFTANLDSLGTSETPLARHLIALTQERAQLAFQSRRDLVWLTMNDPVAYFDRLNRFYGAPTDVARREAGTELVVNDRVEKVMELTLMAIDFDEEHAAERRLSARERDRLKSLLPAAEDAINEASEMTKRRSEQVDAFRMYYGFLASEHSHRHLAPGQSMIRPRSAATRVCGGTAALLDPVRFDAEVGEPLAVVITRVQFDHGRDQLTVFRRLEKTNTFVGFIAWPVDASTASLKVSASGSSDWSAIDGIVTPGRGPLIQSKAAIEQGLAMLKKRYQDASARADAVPTVRTMIIP
jgi:hypothetical protein